MVTAVATLQGKDSPPHLPTGDTSQKLAELAAEQNAEFVTLFSGEGVSDADAEAAAELFTQRCADAEVSALPGGQPVYYYIISIE